MALLARSPAGARRLILAGAASFLAVAADTAAAPPLEDAVKATYIYKFAPFVTWPAPPAQGATFDLCIEGTDTVAALLPQATAGQQIDGRPIAIRPVSENQIPANCHILYIADGNAPVAALNAVREKPVLTITGGDAAEHGIIQLKVIDHHVRFDIDESLAAVAHLSISSKLLSLAHAVTPAKEAN
jgi:hypothetical protein